MLNPSSWQSEKTGSRVAMAVAILVLILVLHSSDLFASSDSAPPSGSINTSSTDAGLSAGDGGAGSGQIVDYSFEIVHTFPHDPAAHTQGLVYEGGIFYESTGLYGHSTLRKVDPETGKVLLGARLPDDAFGEGITLLNGKIYLLTWRARTGLVIDAATLQQLGTFRYSTEGWGLTNDGSRLIMSDGSARLTFLDPETLSPISTLEVVENGQPVTQLNELEYIDGLVYANVWKTGSIVIIDLATGQVTGRIDLGGLLPPEDRSKKAHLLNGIAFDPSSHRLFVTGKHWPYLYEIRLVRLEGKE